MRDRYLNWLMNLVCQGTSKHKRKYYTMLLEQLYLRNYEWEMPLDGDRATWGITLRDKYCKETGAICSNKDGLECSMLEMMVRLAINIEDQYSFESDDDFYDHVSDWFWGMISSMGLNKNDDYDYDDRKTDIAIDKVLKRGYSKNGKGGLFTLEVNEKHVDMRNTDIWHQAMLYQTELYKKSGILDDDY